MTPPIPPSKPPMIPPKTPTTPPPKPPAPQPSGRPRVDWEKVNKCYYLRFWTQIPDEIDKQIRRDHWRFEVRFGAYVGASASWSVMVGLLAKWADLRHMPGKIYPPGATIYKAAVKALTDELGGDVPTEEGVRKTAEVIRIKCSAEDLSMGRSISDKRKQAAEAAKEVVKASKAGGKPVSKPAAKLADFDISGFPAWCAEHIRIQDKLSLAYVPFVLNKLQWKAWRCLEKQWKEVGFIRQNWLKHRRWGGSILVQAFTRFLAGKVQGVEALLIAHRDDASQDIFRRAQVMEQHCLDKPMAAGKTIPLKKDNRRELQWEAPHHSAIRMAVADDEGFGHGSTRHILHATEVARWTDRGEKALIGILSSIQDVAGTMVVKESTARGVTGTFYRGWIDVEEKRGGGYVNFFVGWLEDETCRWEVFEKAWGPLPEEDDKEKWASTPQEWLDDEPRLKALGACWSQLAWRRQMIPAKCESSAAVFTEQYPATWQEAFLNSGSNYFPLARVDAELKRTSEAELRTPAPRFRLNAQKTEFVRDPFGPLRIWKRAEPGHPYLIAVDTAAGITVDDDKGSARLDYTTMRVIDRWTIEEVACHHGRGDPDLLAHDAVLLARMYNNALLAIESNHSSGVVMIVRALRELRYSNLFSHENVSKGTASPIDQDPEVSHRIFGWKTGPGSGITKGIQLQYLHTRIRDGTFKVNDPDAWSQMRQFIRTPAGLLQAERSAHDDIVMAQSIAMAIIAMHPMLPPAEIVKKEVKFMSKPWFDKLVANRKKRRAGVGGDYA